MGEQQRESLTEIESRIEVRGAAKIANQGRDGLRFLEVGACGALWGAERALLPCFDRLVLLLEVGQRALQPL